MNIKNRHLIKNIENPLYLKARIHVEQVAQTKSPKFMFYRVLNIVNRRVKRTLHEEHLRSCMVPKNNGCFVDVGANVGKWTRYLADKGATVHAFEPTRRNCELLETMFKKNSNVDVHKCALGEGNYFAKLKLHTRSGCNGFVVKGKGFIGYELVPVRTLDSFGFTAVGLIKIDTEGYEIPVLLGAKETILNCKPRLIIEPHLDYMDQTEKICIMLQDLGYTWQLKYSPRRSKPHIIGDFIED